MIKRIYDVWCNSVIDDVTMSLVYNLMDEWLDVNLCDGYIVQLHMACDLYVKRWLHDVVHMCCNGVWSMWWCDVMGTMYLGYGVHEMGNGYMVYSVGNVHCDTVMCMYCNVYFHVWILFVLVLDLCHKDTANLQHAAVGQ